MADISTKQAADMKLGVARGIHANAEKDPNIFADNARRAAANRTAPYVPGTQDEASAAAAAQRGARAKRTT